MMNDYELIAVSTQYHVGLTRGHLVKLNWHRISLPCHTVVIVFQVQPFLNLISLLEQENYTYHPSKFNLPTQNRPRGI